MNKTKTCIKCGEEKNEGEFYFTSFTRKDGTRAKRAECKTCMNKRTATWVKNNPEQQNENTRKWNEANRFRVALNYSRNDAKKHGYMSCDATAEEIEAAFTGLCHNCGVAEEDCVGPLNLDHDHVTRKFRGWLCSSCNARDVFATEEKAGNN